MGAICCHGNQSFDSIWSKTSYSLSPIPMMLLIKFHRDRPTGCRDIHVWNCGRRTPDGRRTMGILKAHLRAFGSGELKTSEALQKLLTVVLTQQIGIFVTFVSSTVENFKSLLITFFSITSLHVPNLCTHQNIRHNQRTMKHALKWPTVKPVSSGHPKNGQNEGLKDRW